LAFSSITQRETFSEEGIPCPSANFNQFRGGKFLQSGSGQSDQLEVPSDNPGINLTESRPNGSIPAVHDFGLIKA